jgi:hypothetical protein
MLTELLKAPVSRLVISLCVLTLLACPGALAIWMMQPEQFKTFNPFQLIVLSVGLILPFVVVNSIAVAVAFPLHRWFAKYVRNRNVRPPREGVLATGVVFAGAIGAIIPAYAPILAHILGHALTIGEMAIIAVRSEVVPFLLLILLNPYNHWKGIDDHATKADDAPKPLAVAVNLHVHRYRQPLSGNSASTTDDQTIAAVPLSAPVNPIK